MHHTLRTTLARAVVLLVAAAAAAPVDAQTDAPRSLLPFPLGLVAPDPGARDDDGLLLVPVEGVEREALRDSYHDGRSQGRTHYAIDIHAPRGTPVLAVADGRILRLHSGARGGRSIYLLDDDGTTRYYYAHLDGYATGLRQGQRVQRGEVIGFVGDTGNAARGDYHLHFSVAILDDPARWWQGRNLNPYELLRGGER